MKKSIAFALLAALIVVPQIVIWRAMLFGFDLDPREHPVPYLCVFAGGLIVALHFGSRPKSSSSTCEAQECEQGERKDGQAG